MQRAGHRAAYDVLELRRPGAAPGYRLLAGGREFLVNGNHIGQTVLVHERSLVDEVGGYDEELPRTVDFDFILRLSAVTDFGFAPFVGCVVNHDPADVSRITRSHPATWIDVVLNRNTLDWSKAAGPEELGATVVVIAPADVDAMTDCVERLVQSTDGTGAEILVVDNGLELMASQVLGSLAFRQSRVRVVAAPSDRGWAVALNLGALAARTDRVVLVDPAVLLEPGWLPPLVAALDSPAVTGAVPALLAPLAPLAESAGRSAAAPQWGVCALRVSDLVPVHGLDPLMRPELAVDDLLRRLAPLRHGSFAAVAEAVVVLPDGGLHPTSRHGELDQAAADAEGRELFGQRWGR
jgi:O-antigen biosynthesis protein